MPNWKKVVVSGSSAALSNLTVDNALTASGLIYPTVDGTSGQFLTTDGTGSLTFADVSATDAEATHIPVKNTTLSQIDKGTPVYITGNVGNSERLEIAPADASDISKMPAVGLLETTLAANGEGYVVQGGYLRQLVTATIDGTATTSNDTVYVKAGGGLTMTKPTGDTNYIQNIAKIARSHSSAGSVIVSSILRTNDVPNLPTGKIWVGSAANTVTSSVVHLDETNDRLGIGTTTPQDTLHVEGNITGSGNLTISDHSYASNNNNRLRITPNYTKSSGTETGIYLYGNRTGSYASNVSTYHFANELRVASTGSAYTTSDHINQFNRLTVTEGTRYDDLFGFYNIVRVNGDGNVGDQVQTLTNLFQISGTGTITNDEVYGIRNEIDINNANSTVGEIVNLYARAGLTAGSASAYYGIDLQQSVNANYHITGDYALIRSNETFVPTVGGSTYNIYLPAAMESYLGGDLNIGQAISASGAITGSDVKIDDWGSVSASLASLNAAAATIDGTGAANKVAIWSDSDTLTSDTNLHWNSTNDRLGIGTTTPAAALDVSGDAFIQNNGSLLASGSGFFRTGNSNGGTVLIGGDGSISYIQAQNNRLVLQTGRAEDDIEFKVGLNAATSSMFIDGANSNVGIGTTSPSAPLHIVENSTLDALFIESTNGGSDASPVITLKRNSATPADGDYLGQIKFKGENDADAEIVYAKITGKISDVTDTTEDGLIETAVKKAGTNVIVARQTSTDLKLINGTGLQVDGDVGIGTTAPNSKLEIVDSITFANVDTFGQLAIKSTTGTTGDMLNFGVDDTNNVSFIQSVNRGTNIIPLSLQRYGGNVGIGTSSPSYKLDIDGDLRVLSSSISYQENIDVDSAAAETVATVTIADFDAAFFDYVIKSGTNLRAGTVTAVHDGTNVEYNEVSTQDLGDTSDVTLSVDISGADMRLRATTTSNNWEIKSLVRTI